MRKVYYNSWLPKYKNPFGAVRHGKTITFRILASSEEVSDVSLIIRKESDNGAAEGKMYRSSLGGDLFEIAYTLQEEVGIYYYFFKIESVTSDGWKHTDYYGANNGRGGEGTSYNDYNQAWNNSYSITCFQQEETPPSWYRERIFYQIFPDRFATHLETHDGIGGQTLNPKDNIFVYGKKTDQPYYVKDEKGIIRWDFFGGTLQGIIDKIPYLKDELGVNAIYLNPIFEAKSNHRYDTSDYFNIDPMLGDERVLRTLIQKLHENDMRIILDGVFSHVGKNSRYFNFNGEYGEDIGAAKSKRSIFYPWFKFVNWPNDYKSWWGIDDLPEINKYDQTFQEYIYGDVDSVLSKWNHFDIDGWRLDVADELPDEFISGIRKNLDTYPEKILIGEVWEDASRKYSYDKRRMYIYGKGLYGCMNYPFREIILSLLNGQSSPMDIAMRLTELQENYPKDVFLNNFNNIGTHDTERVFTMLGEDKNKLDIAFGLMVMLPGVPCFYYGDEAGVVGGKDPDNRKFFPWGAEDRQIMDSMKKWVRFRKGNTPLIEGEMDIFYDNNIFGIFRYTESEYSLYIVNPTEKTQTVQTHNLNFARFSPFGTDVETLVDILDEIEIEPFQGILINQ